MGTEIRTYLALKAIKLILRLLGRVRFNEAVEVVNKAERKGK